MNGDFDLYVLNGKIKELNEKIENLKKENIFLPKKTCMTEEKSVYISNSNPNIIEYEFEFPVKFNYVKIRRNDNANRNDSSSGTIYFINGENSVSYPFQCFPNSDSIYTILIQNLYLAGSDYRYSLNRLTIQPFYASSPSDLFAQPSFDIYFTKIRMELSYSKNIVCPFYVSVCYTEN